MYIDIDDMSKIRNPFIRLNVTLVSCYIMISLNITSYTCLEMDYSPHFYILLALAVISTSEFSVQGFQLPLPNDIDGEDLGKISTFLIMWQ